MKRDEILFWALVVLLYPLAWEVVHAAWKAMRRR